jgi:hypothetical protein
LLLRADIRWPASPSPVRSRRRAGCPINASDFPPAAAAAPTQGEILPPAVQSRPDTNAARALVGRLVRGGDISPALLTLVDGPLADAASKAADYAGKSIAPGTVATYKADLADF